MVVNNVNSVLAQMKSIEAMAQNRPVVEPQVQAKVRPNFAEMMVKAIDVVNNNQQVAADMQKRFEMGDDSVDLAQVIVNSQKANISFQALTEVRNKLLTAYQDVMNMPV